MIFLMHRAIDKNDATFEIVSQLRHKWFTCNILEFIPVVISVIETKAQKYALLSRPHQKTPPTIQQTLADIINKSNFQHDVDGLMTSYQL